MKHRLILGVALLSVGLLAGCGQSSTSQSMSKSSSTSSQKVEQVNWNSNKAKKLHRFMTAWGKTMDQQYDNYTAKHNVKFYGLAYPNELSNNTTAVNDKAVTTELSTTGQGSKDYEVVAVYSDAANSDYNNKHLYLFAFHKNKPIVLVTMQNQGQTDNKIHFAATENTTLTSGFNKIVAGQTPTVKASASATSQSSSASSSSTTTSATYSYEEVGAMLFSKTFCTGTDVNQYPKSNVIYEKSKNANEAVVSTNTGQSALRYKISGDEVQLISLGSETKTDQYSLSSLAQETNSTPAEKKFIKTIMTYFDANKAQVASYEN
ncbi:DUF4767 domain-containing protein [Paucilactobacillus wasatchensis]|uniref:DUF4767 domain-containing protein n=1 Tax=Paucilactobacillus wasatchensis TaxID=1335616 RepID=A0A0D1ACC4_9LACO|nr:DUF4767 domain-containing protein [Paucilactobacillus wasatchensis]KIS04326.1 hypothetical protein WDC_0063 [Paucilactobacillus wasatchensis]